MRLGIAASYPHETPEEWAKQHKDAGFGAVIFPCNADAPRDMIERYRDAALANDKDTRTEPSSLIITIRECILGEGGFDMCHSSMKQNRWILKCQ